MSSMTTIGQMVFFGSTLCLSAAAQATRGPVSTAGAASAKTTAQRTWSMIVVQQKPDFVLWDAETSIKPKSVGLVYDVEQVQGLNLLLTAPGHDTRGWSRSSAVISLKFAEDFFTQAIVIDPKDPFASMMRGIVRSEKGDADGALADLDEALKKDASYRPALLRRAAMLRASNRPDRARADIDRAISLDGRDPTAFVERAVLGFTRRDFVNSWADLDRAIELGSHDVIVPILRGQILLEKKDTKRAHDEFQSALKADSSRHDAYLGLASVYLMRGEAKNAQAVLDDAVRGDPDNPEAYGNRATFHLARGDYEKALFNLDEVIRLSPGSARAYNERAWLLATCRVAKFRDPRKAVELATRACELTNGKNPRYLTTLAAACSESGDYEGAVRSQERALALLDAKSPERTEYRRLLDRYRIGKPHHHLGLLEEMVIRSISVAH